MNRWLAVALVAALWLSSCSDPGASSGSDSAEAGSTESTALSDPPPADDTGTGAIGAGGEPADDPASTGDGGVQPDPSPSSTTRPGSNGDLDATTSTEARQALDVYLDALVDEDFVAAVNASRNGPELFAIIRSVVSDHNRAAGASTELRYERRGFDVAVASDDAVTFSGDAELVAEVRGDGEPPRTSTDVIADPVLRRSERGWRIDDFSVDGRPIVPFPAHGSRQVEGVQINLVGGLAFGNVIGVVIGLVGDGEHTIRIADDRLRAGDLEARSDIGVVVAGQPGRAYFAYPRRDIRPDEWHATITIDGSDHEVTLEF